MKFLMLAAVLISHETLAQPNSVRASAIEAASPPSSYHSYPNINTDPASQNTGRYTAPSSPPSPYRSYQESAAFNTGTFKAPPAPPSTFRPYPNLNAGAMPIDSNAGIYVDPEHLNTSPNPTPQLSPSGQVEDTTTLGTIFDEDYTSSSRQAEEERPPKKSPKNPRDLGTTPDGRPIGPGIK